MKKNWVLFTATVVFIVACERNTVFELNVINGQGSGFYEAGTTIAIRATPPDGQRFIAWEGDTAVLADIFAENALFLMPRRNLNLSAYALNGDTLSFKYEIFPIFQQYCALSGCHLGSSRLSNFVNYEEIAAAGLLERNLLIGFMPLNVEMPEEKRQILLKWIAQGKLNN